MTSVNVQTKDLQGESRISQEHIANNAAVRDMLVQRGIVPESLPPAEDVKKVERRLASEQKRLWRTKRKNKMGHRCYIVTMLHVTLRISHSPSRTLSCHKTNPKAGANMSHHCYNVTLLHVTCYVKDFALRIPASRRRGGRGRGLDRRAGGRQGSWRGRGADRRKRGGRCGFRRSEHAAPHFLLLF